MVQSNPSRNQADNNTLVGALRLAFTKYIQNLNDTLPARVVSYDRTNNRAVVQPTISVINTDGTLIPRPEMVNIPVFSNGGGGFIINFPLQVGDLGWIKASDRDISLFLQSFDDAQPNTERLHSFEDAIFYPDVMHNYTINSEDNDRVVIQTLDGSQRVAIASDQVKITATTINLEADTINMDADDINMNTTNDINMIAVGDILEDAVDVNVVADIQHTGDQNSSGTITGTTDVIGGGKSLKTHTHSGITTGGGTSGPPV